MHLCNRWKVEGKGQGLVLKVVIRSFLFQSRSKDRVNSWQSNAQEV